MMTKRARLVAVAGFAILATGLAVLIAELPAQQTGRPSGAGRQRPIGKPTTVVSGRDAQQWLPTVPPPARLAPPDPSQIYTVEPIPVRGIVPPRTPQQDRDLEAAAAIIARTRPIPEERIRFFDWMNADDSTVTFIGWGVFVQGATPVEGGWHITIRAAAFAMLKSGGGANVNNNYIEEYFWDGATLRFLRGYPDPRLGVKPSISLGA